MATDDPLASITFRVAMMICTHTVKARQLMVGAGCHSDSRVSGSFAPTGCVWPLMKTVRGGSCTTWEFFFISRATLLRNTIRNTIIKSHVTIEFVVKFVL